MRKLRKFQTPIGLLNNTIKYYWGRPERQCTDADHRCKYTPMSKSTDGCAIGRLLPLKLCNELDDIHEPSISNPKIYRKLPKWLRQFSDDFLNQLQKLHDSSAFATRDSGWVIKTMKFYVDESKIKFPV